MPLKVVEYMGGVVFFLGWGGGGGVWWGGGGGGGVVGGVGWFLNQKILLHGESMSSSRKEIG